MCACVYTIYIYILIYYLHISLKIERCLDDLRLSQVAWKAAGHPIARRQPLFHDRWGSPSGRGTRDEGGMITRGVAVWLRKKLQEHRGYHLVGGLEHQFYIFPFSWEFHHPNWLSYFSEGVAQPPTSHGRYNWSIILVSWGYMYYR